MNRRPLVSVIVPSYNKPQYLPECLRSIQAQSFTDWECIVVDDGSPRGEEIRAAVEAMGDSRFRLIKHEVNRGPGAARNTGIRYARAERLLWVDEDDEITARCLERLLTIQSESGAEVVIGRYVDIGSGCVSKIIETPTLERVLAGPPLLGCGFLVSKGAIERIGLFDESNILRAGREDTEWWIRAFSKDIQLCLSSEVFYRYRKPSKDYRCPVISLHQFATLREVEIRRYIISSHERLYAQFPASRRKFLGNGYQRLAQVEKQYGRRERAALMSWLAFLHLRSKRSLRSALELTLRATCGESTVSTISRVWHLLKEFRRYGAT